MAPWLAIVSGPHKGETVPLDGPLTIGRDQENRLCLRDRLASRQHCVIREVDRAFRITDLESSNGTFVNGVPIKERGLRHGDRIKVGGSLFLFAESDEEIPPEPDQVEMRQGSLGVDTRELSIDEAVYLQTRIALPPPSSLERVVRDLRALVRLSTVLHSVRDVEALKRQLLTSLFEVVPAERGAILLLTPSGEVASVFGLTGKNATVGPIEISRTVVDRVLEKGVALLCNNVFDYDDLGASRSLEGVRSVLAVPLVSFGRKLGVVYVDSSRSAARFDENHLQLLTAIAGTAAVALERAEQLEWLGQENERLREDLGIEHNMIGESPAMRGIYEFVAKVAPSDSTVLIRGESGTGKELVARAIHRNSPRVEKPWVAINCAALAETLLESELFGHEKGAFTGATAQKKGKLELAQGGTVFLDEIGELAPALQVKLLRVLQERELERVGGTRSIKIDVRLVAATNKDLQQAAADGEFREDLYYRINVVSLEMPPLRERRADIPLLARYFAEKYSEKCKRRVSGISPAAGECLMGYDWPGNVRELENAIERALVLGSTEAILPEDLPEAVLETKSGSGGPIQRYHAAVLAEKKRLILAAFEESDGNHARAAKRLDVHPNYLHRLVRNMDLRAAIKKTAR